MTFYVRAREIWITHADCICATTKHLDVWSARAHTHTLTPSRHMRVCSFLLLHSLHSECGLNGYTHPVTVTWVRVCVAWYARFVLSPRTLIFKETNKRNALTPLLYRKSTTMYKNYIRTYAFLVAGVPLLLLWVVTQSVEHNNTHDASRFLRWKYLKRKFIYGNSVPFGARSRRRRIWLCESTISVFRVHLASQATRILAFHFWDNSTTLYMVDDVSRMLPCTFSCHSFVCSAPALVAFHTHTPRTLNSR